jgi:hypothetical protein
LVVIYFFIRFSSCISGKIRRICQRVMGLEPKIPELARENGTTQEKENEKKLMSDEEKGKEI